MHNTPLLPRLRVRFLQILDQTLHVADADGVGTHQSALGREFGDEPLDLRLELFAEFGLAEHQKWVVARLPQLADQLQDLAVLVQRDALADKAIELRLRPSVQSLIEVPLLCRKLEGECLLHPWGQLQNAFAI